MHASLLKHNGRVMQMVAKALTDLDRLAVAVTWVAAQLSAIESDKTCAGLDHEHGIIKGAFNKQTALSVNQLHHVFD